MHHRVSGDKRSGPQPARAWLPQKEKTQRDKGTKALSYLREDRVMHTWSDLMKGRLAPFDPLSIFFQIPSLNNSTFP